MAEGTGGPDKPSRNRRPTLHDVAELAGVHSSTASRALDPRCKTALSAATIARVTEAARELGYQRNLVASGLQRGRTLSVSVIVADLTHPAAGSLIRGVTDAVTGHGFVTLTAETLEDSDRLVRIVTDVVGRQVDAVVMAAAGSGDGERLRRAAGHVPVVVAMRDLPGDDFPIVTYDDRKGATLIADHLLSLGHRRAVQISGPDHVVPFRVRRDAFEQRFRSRAGDPASVRTVEVPESTTGHGREAIATLLDSGDDSFTAVFAYSDRLAAGVIQELSARGLSCPRRMSVVGYNNTWLAESLTPRLTTVNDEPAAVGREAARLALQILDGKRPRRRTTLVPSLLVRASTGPAPS